MTGFTMIVLVLVFFLIVGSTFSTFFPDVETNPFWSVCFLLLVAMLLFRAWGSH